MIEIVFSESAGGSLKQSRRCGEGPFRGNVLAVCCKGTAKPSKHELRQARREAERRARQAWESAVPMGDALGDVFPLSLGLSAGGLSEGAFGPERKEVLAALTAEFPPPFDQVSRMLDQAKQNLDAVLARAGGGEDLRIWASALPDDQCALCWLFAELGRTELPGKIRVVELPPYLPRPDGTVVQHCSWGEVCPGEWASFLPFQREAPAPWRRAMADRWQTLKAENAPLRAVINGRLFSVNEDFYDPFLWQELEKQPQVFHQAALIGTILGKYQLGISDGWIALRMEQWIQDGLLEPVPEPAKDHGGILYRRDLKKTARL